jgi:hypothetical protein
MLKLTSLSVGHDSSDRLAAIRMITRGNSSMHRCPRRRIQKKTKQGSHEHSRLISGSRKRGPQESIELRDEPLGTSTYISSSRSSDVVSCQEAQHGATASQIYDHLRLRHVSFFSTKTCQDSTLDCSSLDFGKTTITESKPGLVQQRTNIT